MTGEGTFIENKCIINALQRHILTSVSYISTLIKALSKPRFPRSRFANRVQFQHAFTGLDLHKRLKEPLIHIEFPENFD